MRKHIYKSLGLACLALTSGALFSCTNELSDDLSSNISNSGTMKLAKNPVMTAWSGSQSLGSSKSISTRSANVNGNLWYQTWDRPTNVTEEEIAKVLTEANKVREGAVNNIHIDWNNYWVQQVYTGQQTYVDGYGNDIGTGSSHMNQLLAYSSKKSVQTSWYPEEVFELRDKETWESPYEHVNNFNNGSNDTVYTDDETKEKYYGTTLMTDMYAEDIVNQFGYSNTTDSQIHYEYIILEVDGSYYVCFDFYATHPEGQDANKNMDVERDWIFNDWIVKISPAYLKGQTPENPSTPETPELPDTPDNGIIGDNNNDGDNNDSDNNVTVTPSLPDGGSEVEINLSINDLHIQYNGVEDFVSKLSIHVRYAKDVRVRIPILAQYYVAQDDLAVFNQHNVNFYNGAEHQAVYTVNNKSVTLTVEYDADGITVTTSGIDADVFEYCVSTFGDGLNFEIYNYFVGRVQNSAGEWVASDLSVDDLKGYLDRSTVEFIDDRKNGLSSTDMPNYYINAFGNRGDYNGSDSQYPSGGYTPTVEEDCTVEIVSSQSGYYDNGQTGNHLNGTDKNVIYRKHGVPESENNEHTHKFLWK